MKANKGVNWNVLVRLALRGPLGAWKEHGSFQSEEEAREYADELIDSPDLQEHDIAIEPKYWDENEKTFSTQTGVLGVEVIHKR